MLLENYDFWNIALSVKQDTFWTKLDAFEVQQSMSIFHIKTSFFHNKIETLEQFFAYSSF